MIRQIIPILFLSAIILLSCSDKGAVPPNKEVPSTKGMLRLGSYNVMYAKSNTSTKAYTDENTRKIAQVIDALTLDIVSIQELDSGFVDRQNKRFLLADIAKHSKRNYQLFYAAAHKFQNGTANVGPGILVDKRLKVLQHKVVPLPGDENRALLMVELADFWFIATHWDLQHEHRVTSAKTVIQEIQKLNKPVFLAGDINVANPKSEDFATLLQKFEILTPIEPSLTGSPQTIDYILYAENGTGKQVNSLGSAIVNQLPDFTMQTVSDHYPVWLNIKK